MNDVVLAMYSDRLFMAAVGVYVLAMVLHAAEYAALRAARAGDGAPAHGRRRRRRRSDDDGSRSAGSDGDGRRRTCPTPVPLDAAADPADRLGAVGGEPRRARGAAAARVDRAAAGWPTGPLAAGQHVRVHLRDLPRRGGDLAGRAAPLPGAAGRRRCSCCCRSWSCCSWPARCSTPQAAPVMPALQSYWLVVHVTTIAVSSGLLLVPGVASLLFLLRRSGRRGGSGRAAAVGRRPWTGWPTAPRSSRSRCTPSASSPARSGRRRRGAGSGAGTPRRPSRSSPGSSTPPTCTPARPRAGAAAGRRGSTSPGFAVVLFNLFFINMVVAGLHSYAGV